jgi:hypothetical protein
VHLEYGLIRGVVFGGSGFIRGGLILFFLKLGWTLMGISQSELSFGMMQFCLPNKKRVGKNLSRASQISLIASLLLSLSKNYFDFIFHITDLASTISIKSSITSFVHRKSKVVIL